MRKEIPCGTTRLTVTHAGNAWLYRKPKSGTVPRGSVRHGLGAGPTSQRQEQPPVRSDARPCPHANSEPGRTRNAPHRPSHSSQETHGGGHPQASKGRKFSGPTAQATGGASPPPHPPHHPAPPFLRFPPAFPTPRGHLQPRGRPSPGAPARTHPPRPRAAPARGSQTGGDLRPPHRAAATPPPHGPPARAARPLGQEVASPLAGRGGEGTHVSARRPGPRPLGCGSAPTARGSALLGAGSSRRGFPPGPGRGCGGGGLGRGGERGLGRRGKRGRKGGNQTRKGRKGGRGEIRRGRKGPESAPPPRPARCVTTSGYVTAPCGPLTHLPAPARPRARSAPPCVPSYRPASAGILVHLKPVTRVRFTLNVNIILRTEEI